ncbi:hypothetical protein [Alloactinosynnema sp. L-07]|uniref:YciI family protein n=1 Tax=Alloactinosynnema sp. L-07 TaxID=1653480 RepID=UPI00065EF8FF|nr:YciI family protein [Alloactinosynnema sp. L-07]CRK61661.1 hypothetical protein [Alloactinosynnema sp. L-07]
MYVVLITYTAPLEEIDYVLADHSAWIGKQYEAGYFLASGRRDPRTGGVIITRPMNRDKLNALLATDPFALRKLAHYDVIAFTATRTARELAHFNEAIMEHL